MDQPRALSATKPQLADGLQQTKFLLFVLAFNCLIGFSVWLGKLQPSLPPALATSNAIGFTAFWLSVLSRKYFDCGSTFVVHALVIAPTSAVFGLGFTTLAQSDGNSALLVLLQPSLRQALLTSIAITAVASTFAFMFFRSLNDRALLERQRREAAELRQSETAARLALLQAQIEPHFLFNTLANVCSLINEDPRSASAMLEHLNRYLRASLGRTRKALTTLDDELALIDALLSIAAMRIGDRLRYLITVADDLRALPLPPLLLQPLVENALIHGIEPSVEGWDILIDVRREGNILRLKVVDSGSGLNANSELHTGVGLANVRARLVALYGNAATLTIESNELHGVTSSLYLPC